MFCTLAHSRTRREHRAKAELLSQMNPEKRAILPSLAFRGFASRYQRPVITEGFQDITEVAFTVRHCFRLIHRLSHTDPDV